MILCITWAVNGLTRGMAYSILKELVRADRPEKNPSSVTNREIDEGNNPIYKFGNSANPKGISELRLAKASKADDQWNVEVIPEKRSFAPETTDRLRPSFRLFTELQANMERTGRNCVFFVHGYNTNFKSALETANNIETRYDVEVILFSWPSRGGGEGEKSIGKDFLGTASYKRDKRIAQESTGALDRCFETLARYIKNSECDCGQRFSLVCHSMGNYLLKNLLKHSIYQGETLIFDNIALCAADVNNAGHEAFVDRIAHRRRIYVTINENDFALAWSRRKLGEAQRARLGHYTRNLKSNTAIYVDVTDSRFVGKSHGYFADPKIVDNNDPLSRFFRAIFNGERGERTFPDFDPNKAIYQLL